MSMRPWRDYAQTVFLVTAMSAHVRPEGWDHWKKPYAEKVSRYSEFGSTGPGANPAARVKWAKPTPSPTPSPSPRKKSSAVPTAGTRRKNSPSPARLAPLRLLAGSALRAAPVAALPAFSLAAAPSLAFSGAEGFGPPRPASAAVACCGAPP